MRILIIKGGFGDVYEPAWAKALSVLGHEVYMFDCHQFTLPSILGRLERRFLIGPSIGKIRKKSVDFARFLKPDIILLYQGHYHDLQSVNELRKIAWTTGYHNDNPFSALEDGRHSNRYKHLISSLAGYDSFHVYRDCNIEQFQNSGIKYVNTLMSYYIPELDFPSNKKSLNLGADVIFAGHPERDGRELYLNALIREGMDFKLYGDGRYWKPLIDTNLWSKLNKVKVLSTLDYRLALNSSKICLSFFSKWNRDQYTRRVFEIPAMQKFLLTERTEIMQDLYKEGLEAEYFSSIEEMLDKTRYYLKNDIAREKIAKAGYIRCTTSGYDIYTRMQHWLIEINNWKNEKSKN